MEPQLSSREPVRSDAQRQREQLLTFVVAGEEFGVDILRVQEIRSWSRPMPLPRTPEYVKGVINIRGDIVPIADLRERLGLATQAAGPTTVIVVLRVEHGGKSRTMGIVVDAMSDVTDVARDQIKPPPDLAETRGVANLTRGIALVDERMITLLDVDGVFPPPTDADAAA
ncbi:MAG: chemotaxis protein CheW [Deltaproteobacteria bacterium]|nr:chemotaxis protein CheW [Deltaproteobacteria bacterium]